MSNTPSASPSPSPRPDLAPFGAVLSIADDVIVQERAAFCPRSRLVRPLVRGQRLREVSDDDWPAFVEAAAALASAAPPEPPKRPDPRLALGAAAVLSPTQAAELLPGREAENMRWLRDAGLVRSRPGLPDVVIVGDVLEALRAPASPPAPAATPRATLKRARIN